jgi:hypothetical protein
MPRTVASGRKPGNRNASSSRRGFRIRVSCQISHIEEKEKTLEIKGFRGHHRQFSTHSVGRRAFFGSVSQLPFAALFVRQLALAVFLAFLVASPLRLGFGRRWLLYAMSPTLLAGVRLAAYSRVLAHFGRLPGMYYLKANSLNDSIRDLLHFRLGALKPALRAAIMMFMLA